MNDNAELRARRWLASSSRERRFESCAAAGIEGAEATEASATATRPSRSSRSARR
jgi:hypothetical protein